MKCACCGAEMMLTKEDGHLMFYRCNECGLSNTQLKENSNK